MDDGKVKSLRIKRKNPGESVWSAKGGFNRTEVYDDDAHERCHSKEVSFEEQGRPWCHMRSKVGRGAISRCRSPSSGFPIVARWSLRRVRGAGLYFIWRFGCLNLYDLGDERH